MYHEHPVRIMKYSLKNIWLLIFPLLRGLNVFRFNAQDFYIWLKGAWLDILVIGIIMLFGFVQWYFSRIYILEDSIVHRSGFLLRVRKAVPFDSVSVATAEYPFYLIPIKGVRLSCDTRAGFAKSADMKVLVTEKVCREIMKHMPDVVQKDINSDIKKPNAVSVLLFSVFFSSGFSGVVYITAFFMKGGNIAHDIILMYLNRVTEATEKISSKFLLKIPAVALIVGVIFVSAWLLSFFVNMLRYSRFHIESDMKCIKIACGITNRRQYRIKVSHMNYIDLRQNLIMKIAGAVSVSVSCAGYGADSHHIPVLLPIKMEKHIGKSLSKFGVTSDIERDFKPKITSWFNYTFQPLIFSIALFPANSLFVKFFPNFAELSRFFAIMLEIPAVWLIIVKTAALLTSGISFYDDKILIKCSHLTDFHTIISDRANAVKLEIRQTVFQKISKKCSVSVWLCGEKRSKYTVRAINMSDAVKIADILGHEISHKNYLI